VPAPKQLHKPPIIIYQGVAPPVHVYEKSSGGYSPVAQAKSGESPAAQAKSGDVVSFKDSAVAQSRSAQVSSAVVGASVSVKDEGFEILKKGTVEDINPKS
jgi:hypothetical protein